jgi:hypothetical protein
MKNRTLLAALCIICVGLPALLRAQPSASERFDRTQRELPMARPPLLNLSTNTEAPELYPGENADVGPQRILRLQPRKTRFEIAADSQYFYTDNAFLSDDNKQGTTLFVNTIQAAFAPEPYAMGSGRFAPMLGFRHQWFNYDLDAHDNQLNVLDFAAQTAFLNGRYQTGKWQWYGGFDFTRLLEQDNYGEVYREYVPTIAIQRFFPINDNFIIIAGGQFSYHFTDTQTNGAAGTDVNDRYDATFSLSLNYQVVPRLILQPFYRFQYTHFPEFSDGVSGISERDDLMHTAGLTVAYYFRSNIAMRLFVSYELKDSDYTSAFDYSKIDAGGGLALSVRF